MPVARTKDVVDRAQQLQLAAVAFNVITLEHAEAVVMGAEAAGSPVIIQISENAVRYHRGLISPLLDAAVALARAATVPVALHFDHVEDESLIGDVAAGAFSSLMFDASRKPYEANVAATYDMTRWAHDHGLWIEAELGEIGGKDGAHAPGVRTDPDAAAEFVERTGVDALAVAVGSSHGMRDRTAVLDRSLISRLRAALPVPLVLHGSSGVSSAELAAAVKAGITKVNVGTVLNICYTAAIRDQFGADAEVVDPRKYLDPARNAMQVVVAEILRGVAVAPSSRR
jgi:fructose-bisphosphate aldolase class II